MTRWVTWWQSVNADDMYTVAGTESSGFSGDGGSAGSALFDTPDRVTLVRSPSAPSSAGKPALEATGQPIQHDGRSCAKCGEPLPPQNATISRVY
jgi:hypothetical protein